MEEHVAESMFLPFLAMFASIYLVGYFIVFRAWGPRRRAEAASCFTSLFHALADPMGGQGMPWHTLSQPFSF